MVDPGAAGVTAGWLAGREVSHCAGQGVWERRTTWDATNCRFPCSATWRTDDERCHCSAN